jgi:hypothetical protein
MHHSGLLSASFTFLLFPFFSYLNRSFFATFFKLRSRKLHKTLKNEEERRQPEEEENQNQINSSPISFLNISISK